MAKAPTEIMVNGKNIIEMTWPELQKFVVQMTDELLLVRGDRTKIRKECDLMRTCWENSEKDIEEIKANFLKKYMEGDVLWDKHKVPYAENEQEITFHKFIMNYNVLFDEKENRKRIETINKNWEKEELPKLMEAKTREALRFDQKQKDINAEHKNVQAQYKEILDEAVKRLDEKIVDWRVGMYKRIAARINYIDLQFILRKLCYSEQKNLLIQDLNTSHNFNFGNIRSFIRERIEGDLIHISTLNQEINKLQSNFLDTDKEISRYDAMVKEKKEEYEKKNKALKLYEMKLFTYKRNVDSAYRGASKINKLEKDKEAYDKRRQELEEQIRRRMNDKSTYVNIIRVVHNEMKQFQNNFIGDDFLQMTKNFSKDLDEFDELLMEYEKKAPEYVKLAKEKYSKEKKAIKEMPFLVTRELKGHNDFLESVMLKLRAIGLPHVPDFVRVTTNMFPTGTGPAGLTNV